jgi:phage terminase Nu1 subunit (DNA packaging protein)
MAETTYGRETIAKLLMVTPRYVTTLSQKAIIPKAENGRYPLVPTIQGYVKYLRDRALRGDVEDSDFGTHKARLTRAQADLAELQWLQAKGNVLPRAAVLAAWQQTLAAARAKLLAIPTKTAGRVLAVGTLPEVEAILQEHIHEALAELARSDGLPAGRGAGSVETAAEAERQPVGRRAPPAKPGGKRGAGTVANQPRRVPARNP